MRSAPTGHPAPEPDDRADGPIRARPRPALPPALVLSLVLTTLLATLSGCATGRVEEARGGQARDAATDPSLPPQQATRTVERFFPTPERPTPTPLPMPTLGELVVTIGVDGGGAPQGSYAAVPADAGTVYAAALLGYTWDGQIVSARWVDATGITVNTVRVEIDGDATQRWVALPLGSPGSVALGEYAVYLYVGERRLSSLLFQVSPAGSGGVLLPPRPENPSADRGGPGETIDPPRSTTGPGGQNPTQNQPQNQEGAPVDPNVPPAAETGLAPTPWGQ